MREGLGWQAITVACDEQAQVYRTHDFSSAGSTRMHYLHPHFLEPLKWCIPSATQSHHHGDRPLRVMGPAQQLSIRPTRSGHRVVQVYLSLFCHRPLIEASYKSRRHPSAAFIGGSEEWCSGRAFFRPATTRLTASLQFVWPHVGRLHPQTEGSCSSP